MASVIAYYRPRGFQGNYKVGIYLNLALKESAEVYRGKEHRNILIQKEDEQPEGFYEEDSKLIRPVNTIDNASFLGKKQGKTLIYLLTPFSHREDNTFHITIKDKEIAGEQTEYYRACIDEIEKVKASEMSKSMVTQNVKTTKSQRLRCNLLSIWQSKPQPVSDTRETGGRAAHYKSAGI